MRIVPLLLPNIKGNYRNKLRCVMPFHSHLFSISNLRSQVVNSYVSLFNASRLAMRPYTSAKQSSATNRTTITETAKYVTPQAEALRASHLAVNFAIGANFLAAVIKFVTFFFTGSGSMLSESIHSLADMANQLLLAIGIRRSQRAPTKEYPYGFSTERFIWALISAVGIFFLGCGASVYHGVSILLDPHPLESLPIAFSVLGISAALESVGFIAAVRAIIRAAKANGLSFWGYVVYGPDPTSVAVLMEDGSAIFGLSIAAVCLGLCYAFANPMFDAIGSILIGFLLGAVAIFLIRKNTIALLGHTIPPHRKKIILSILEKDPVVKAVYDAKATTMGADTLRFTADIEWNGKEIARRYLQNQNISRIFKEIKDEKDLENFLVKYGEAIIEQIGDEVDRLEKKIQESIPEARYVDLETS
jgi:zinc transporter 9